MLPSSSTANSTNAASKAVFDSPLRMARRQATRSLALLRPFWVHTILTLCSKSSYCWGLPSSNTFRCILKDVFPSTRFLTSIDTNFDLSSSGSSGFSTSKGIMGLTAGPFNSHFCFKPLNMREDIAS